MFAPSRPGPSARLLAALIAVSLPLGALPVPAAAAGPQPGLWALAAPTDTLTADAAASARKPTQDKAKSLLESSPDDAAELLADEAAKKADPVLHIDAAEAYKVAGAKNKSRVDLENGIEQARVGLDILYFLQDPRADPDWQPVEAAKVASEISRGEKAIEGCERAIEDLSNKKEEPAPVVEDEGRKKAPRDGRGLIAAGSVFTLVGVAGLAMIGGGVGMGVSAQNHVEGLNASDPDYAEQKAKDDDKGALGNTLVYAGIPVAVVGLATGIALLVVGVKKRKKYRAEHGGSDDNTARVQVLPMMGRGVGGLSLSGRF